MQMDVGKLFNLNFVANYNKTGFDFYAIKLSAHLNYTPEA